MSALFVAKAEVIGGYFLQCTLLPSAIPWPLTLTGHITTATTGCTAEYHFR